jgi:hypothetical protein
VEKGFNQKPAMKVPETLLDVRTHTAAGYLPLVDFASWRVAILNFGDELRPENITAMQQNTICEMAADQGL